MANSKHEVTIKVQGDSSGQPSPSPAQAPSPTPTNSQSDMSKEMHSRAKELVEQSKDESGSPTMTYHQALSQSGKSVYDEYAEARQAPPPVDHDQFTRVGIGGNKVDPEIPEEVNQELSSVKDVEPVEIDPERLLPSFEEMRQIWSTVFGVIEDFGGKISEEHLQRALEMTEEFYGNAPIGTQTGFAESSSKQSASPTRFNNESGIVDAEFAEVKEEDVVASGVVNADEAKEQQALITGGEVEEEDGLLDGDLMKQDGALGAVQDEALDTFGLHIPEMSSKFDTDTAGHIKAMGQASMDAAGSTAGASSASDALSFVGGMTRAAAGMARDIPARGLGMASRQAKMGIGVLTGGTVQPTSSEEEFGGEGGGGGGGGGGDGGSAPEGGDSDPMQMINAKMGDLIDDIFSAPLKPIDMFIEVMEKGFEVFMQLNAAVEKAYDEVMGFSGAMIEARVSTELDLMSKRMGRANRMGEDFADFEDSRRELLTSFEDTKEILLRVIVPIVTFIMNIVAFILKLINMILAFFMVIIELFYKVIEFIGYIIPVTAILEGIGNVFDWITGWLLGSDEETSNDWKMDLNQWINHPQGAIAPKPAGANIWAVDA